MGGVYRIQTFFWIFIFFLYLQGPLAMVHKIVRGLITADLKATLFLCHSSTYNSAVRTRGHTFKLKTTRYRLNIAQHLFFNRVVSTWNGLPQNIVNLESSPEL